MVEFYPIPYVIWADFLLLLYHRIYLFSLRHLRKHQRAISLIKPGFHMIFTIVAIATIVQKFDLTIATILTILTILTIHGFHMIIAIVAIAAVLWLNASKQMMDILFSLLLLLIVSLPILSQSDGLSKLLVIFLCLIKTESHSNLWILFVQGLHLLRYRPLPIQL